MISFNNCGDQNSLTLTSPWILQPRAQVATELLLELNEDVSGDYIEEVCILDY